MKALVEKLKQGMNLDRQSAAILCENIITSSDSDAVALVLRLLHDKGETSDEVCGFVDVMQNLMRALPYPFPACDLVGTGGDGANTVNISTAASLVVASCGATVIKHGNRSSSSLCGSADFIEQVGIPLEVDNDQLLACIKQTHYGFCFAPIFHPAFAKLKAIRQSLAIRTIFNLMGPLLNPANVSRILLGVYKPELVSLYADVLSERKITHGMVVYGSGLDELNCLGPNNAIEIKEDMRTTLVLDPKDFGLPYCTLSDLEGGDAAENLSIMTAVLKGERMDAIAHTIALNAGAALYLSETVSNIKAGVDKALENIAAGKPLDKLFEIKDFYERLSDA